MIYVDPVVSNWSTNDSSPRGWLLSRASLLSASRQPLIFSVPLRDQGRKRAQIYSPSMPRETLHLVHRLLRFLLLRRPLLTLYTSICYMPRSFVRRWTRGVVREYLPTYSTGVLSPLAIFDQYYKNQPTDFLREILPPRVPEYFITVHVPAAPQRMPRPFLLSPGTARRRGRKRNGKLKKQRRLYSALLRSVQNPEKPKRISSFNDFRLFWR